MSRVVFRKCADCFNICGSLLCLILIMTSIYLLRMNRVGGQSEVIKPTVNGALNIMRSCSKAKTVKRVIYTSTTGTIVIQQHPQSEYDESFWTDVDFCKAQKMTGWVSIHTCARAHAFIVLPKFSNRYLLNC